MPSIIVKIEWDVPDEPNWLNPYNLELALSEYCPNTAFEVRQWPPASFKVEEFYQDNAEDYDWV
jgi:hypothetical protein